MRKELHSLVICLLFSLFCSLSAWAQVTTASMSGVVTSNGEPVIGATIMAVHQPSGTNYGTITNLDGRFDLQGMRTGGPYEITISYIGYQTAVYQEVMLQLGETYNLNVEIHESSEELDEVVVTAARTRFVTEKTGAALNISNEKMNNLPTINRSIEDIARLSPYASGMSIAGGDGRSTNFTVDGANFNNNFGLSDGLPGGGNPISMDAIEEVQVVVAPFDVRQTNFIGGGINAITKSGTNTFKGTAYTYHQNQNMRGNNIDGEDLGARPAESKHIYGATFGGPIVKDKLFFFANVEYEKVPQQVIQWRARQDGEAADADNYVSRTYASDMEKVANHLREKYGYDPGSYTDFPADETNLKLLGRIDWNINDNHKLAVRYNYTKNTAWNAPNGNSGDFLAGGRLNGTSRVGQMSMAFANSMYSMDNLVNSVSADLNSRFSDKVSNQLLFTYTNIQDKRGSNSDVFPFIDIMAGKNADGSQIMEPYISAGYELFTYNNAVNNKIFNVTDNFTYFLGDHKLTAGISYEHQLANNAYMREGSGYYRYSSLEDFLNDEAPEAVALTYGYNGESNPTAQVVFNQLGFYLQDEWNIQENFKLTYGMRFDELFFNDDDIMRNNAVYALDFNGRHIDTGAWPKARMQFSPRVGFVWDVFKDKSLKVRGGTGLFTGRLPLVYFTNMPTNSGMIQTTVTYGHNYNTGEVSPELELFKGGIETTVDGMIDKLGLPRNISPEDGRLQSKIAGVDHNFKMPQVWKSSIAVDYQLPVAFPFTATAEFMYTKNVNAVTVENYNIQDASGWERFSGADNRLIYPDNYTYYDNINAVVLTNTHKGHGYTANLTLNATPVRNLDLMAAYTHTEFKEVSGLPGSDPLSTWQGMLTIDGPNYGTVQRSRYVVPDKVIASLSYYVPFTNNKVTNGLHFNLYYSGYSPTSTSYAYTNDMNGDGINNDLMYIPKDDSEIQFVDDADRTAFWNFVNQDSYLSSHKGEYAEAYAGRAPWVHRFDFRIAQDFSIKAGKSNNTLQISLDFMNVGNMLNHAWGVTKTNTISNGGRILTYEGMDANNRPTFSMWKDGNGNAPTETYSLNRNYNECWSFQVGVRYIFN